MLARVCVLVKEKLSGLMTIDGQLNVTLTHNLLAKINHILKQPQGPRNAFPSCSWWLVNRYIWDTANELFNACKQVKTRVSLMEVGLCYPG